MTSVRFLAGLVLLGAAGVALARSSAGPKLSAAPAATAGSPNAPALESDSASSTPAPLPGATPARDEETPLAPIFSATILRSRLHAQERILGRDQATEDELGRTVPARQVALDEGRVPAPVNGNALGRFVLVENEAALAHFHRALEELTRTPDRKNKVRIAAYGASHTQADIYSSYLRYYLQERFGNGGPGFIPLGMLRTWSRRDFQVRTQGVQVEYVQAKTAPPPGRVGNARYGLSGSAALAGSRSWLRIAPANDRDPDLTASLYGLFYAAEPEGGEISVHVDGADPILLSTRALAPEPRYHTFTRPLGWHEVEVRGNGQGQTRLFGLSIERLQPGVVIDTLGIRGTRASSMLHWDQKLWEEHLRRRDPDLVLLAYGTNETTDRNQPIEEYERDLALVLTRLRQALPRASCVLVGPGDFPKSVDGSWLTRPRLLEIIAGQRRMAPQFGCGFWDAYRFMGGAGAMAEWVQAHPRLGSSDHIHLTPRGYVRMGLLLGDALMRAYDARHVPLAERVSVQRSPEVVAASGASAAAGSASP